MKSYPSIPRSSHEFKAHTFDKIDGSNLRFEWNRKNGWIKYGTRNRLFDLTDEVFGNAIPLFHETMAETIHNIAKAERWESVIAFAEFWGRHSFAGIHFNDEPKYLTLFDVAPYKKGLLPPIDFRKLFEDKVPTAKYLGNFNWTSDFRTRVWKKELDGITFEGVVGKAKDGKKIIMSKAKTQAWIESVKLRYSPEESNRIINS